MNNVFEGVAEAEHTALILSTKRNFELVTIPHADPLIIKLRIADAMVSRVFVDGERNSNIIF